MLYKGQKKQLVSEIFSILIKITLRQGMIVSAVRGFQALAIATLIAVTMVESTCPGGCECSYERAQVYCSYVTRVPTRIPAGTRQLVIYGGKIQAIDHNDMIAVRDVEELIIQHTGLELVAPGTFQGFNRLRKLDLSKNLLEVVDDYSFVGCPSLTHLVLFENRIKVLRPRAFYNVSTLERLDLFSNNLAVIPRDIFRHLTCLTRISLTKNIIETIEPGAFRGVESLTELNLWDNRLQDIPVDAFLGLKRLEKLVLKRNILTSISSGVFVPLRSLRTLDLRSNKLVLRSQTFSSLESLEELMIGSNSISELPPFAFTGLSNLTKLIMEANEITKLERGVFSGLNQLEYLILDENRIDFIDDNVFAPMQNLKTLSVMGNGLNLKDGSIFNCLPNLNVLYLARNAFTQIPAPMKLPELKVVVFAFNQLSRLPAKLNLANSTKLEFIEFSGNKISTLLSEHITGFPHLKHLGIANNKIHKFNEQDLRLVFSKLRYLDIRGNPIVCDCEVSWLKNLTIDYFPEPRCASPHNKMLFSETKVSDLVC